MEEEQCTGKSDGLTSGRRVVALVAPHRPAATNEAGSQVPQTRTQHRRSESCFPRLPLPINPTPFSQLLAGIRPVIAPGDRTGLDTRLIPLRLSLSSTSSQSEDDPQARPPPPRLPLRPKSGEVASPIDRTRESRRISTAESIANARSRRWSQKPNEGSPRSLGLFTREPLVASPPRIGSFTPNRTNDEGIPRLSEGINSSPKKSRRQSVIVDNWRTIRRPWIPDRFSVPFDKSKTASSKPGEIELKGFLPNLSSADRTTLLTGNKSDLVNRKRRATTVLWGDEPKPLRLARFHTAHEESSRVPSGFGASETSPARTLKRLEKLSPPETPRSAGVSRSGGDSPLTPGHRLNGVGGWNGPSNSPINNLAERTSFQQSPILKTMAASTSGSRQPPALRSNGTSNAPKYPVLGPPGPISQRNSSLKAGLRSASAPSSNNPPPPKLLPGMRSGSSVQSRVAEISKKFNQDTTPSPNGSPRNSIGSVPGRSSISRGTSAAALPGYMRPKGSVGHSSSSLQSSSPLQTGASASRAERTASFQSSRFPASQSRSSLPRLRTDPNIHSPARPVLFGEIVPGETSASGPGFGIDGNRRTRANADVDRSSSTSWYLGHARDLDDVDLNEQSRCGVESEPAAVDEIRKPPVTRQSTSGSISRLPRLSKSRNGSLSSLSSSVSSRADSPFGRPSKLPRPTPAMQSVIARTSDGDDDEGSMIARRDKIIKRINKAHRLHKEQQKSDAHLALLRESLLKQESLAPHSPARHNTEVPAAMDGTAEQDKLAVVAEVSDKEDGTETSQNTLPPVIVEPPRLEIVDSSRGAEPVVEEPRSAISAITEIDTAPQESSQYVHLTSGVVDDQASLDEASHGTNQVLSSDTPVPEASLAHKPILKSWDSEIANESIEGPFSTPPHNLDTPPQSSSSSFEIPLSIERLESPEEYSATATAECSEDDSCESEVEHEGFDSEYETDNAYTSDYQPQGVSDSSALYSNRLPSFRQSFTSDNELFSDDDYTDRQGSPDDTDAESARMELIRRNSKKLKQALRDGLRDGNFLNQETGRVGLQVRESQRRKLGEKHDAVAAHSTAPAPSDGPVLTEDITVARPTAPEPSDGPTLTEDIVAASITDPVPSDGPITTEDYAAAMALLDKPATAPVHEPSTSQVEEPSVVSPEDPPTAPVLTPSIPQVDEPSVASPEDSDVAPVPEPSNTSVVVYEEPTAPQRVPPPPPSGSDSTLTIKAGNAALTITPGNSSGVLTIRGVPMTQEVKDVLFKRAHACHELMDTEHVYLKNLSIMKEIYMGTAESCAQLSSEDSRALFRNLVELVEFTTKFLKALRHSSPIYAPPGVKSQSRPSRDAFGNILMTTTGEVVTVEKDYDTRIGQVFVQNLEELQRIYINNLVTPNGGVRKLTQLKGNRHIDVWLNECKKAALDMTTNPDLVSLIMNPFQRLMRYGMLLDAIVARTPASHPDLPALIIGKDGMKQVCDYINQSVGRMETVSKIRHRKSGTQPAQQQKKAPRLLRQIVFSARRRMPYLPDGVQGSPDEFWHKTYTEYMDEAHRMEVIGRDVEHYMSKCTEQARQFSIFLMACERIMRCRGFNNDAATTSKWINVNIRLQDIETHVLQQNIRRVYDKVMKPMHKLLKVHAGVFQLIQERNNRASEYERVQDMNRIRGRLEANFNDKYNEWVALDRQLKIELPRLTSYTWNMGSLIRRSFVGIQTEYFNQYHDKLLNVMRYCGIQCPHYWDEIEAEWLRLAPTEAMAQDMMMVRSQQHPTPEALSRPSNSISSRDPSLSVRSETLSWSTVPTPTSSVIRAEPGDVGLDAPQRNSNPLVYMNDMTPWAVVTKSDEAAPPKPKAPQPPPEKNFVQRMFSRPTSGRSKTPEPETPPSNGEGSSTRFNARPKPTAAASSSAATPAAASSAAGSSGNNTPRMSAESYFTSNNRGQSSRPTSTTSGGLFNSAMPMSDGTDQTARQSPLNDPMAEERPVLWVAVSLFEFITGEVKSMGPFPYLAYAHAEVFDVIGEHGDLWLARNQDDPSGRVGWIWNKHFKRLD